MLLHPTTVLVAQPVQDTLLQLGCGPGNATTCCQTGAVAENLAPSAGKGMLPRTLTHRTLPRTSCGQVSRALTAVLHCATVHQLCTFQAAAVLPLLRLNVRLARHLGRQHLPCTKPAACDICTTDPSCYQHV
jgi:hypothetical protein